MIPDTTNPYGVAALFVVPEGTESHGKNYVLYTDGTGAMMSNHAGGLWEDFDPLPISTVLTLNEGTGEYEATRTLDVDLEDVVEWTPWTCYTASGQWYFRSNVRAPWELHQTPEEAEANQTGAPSKPTKVIEREV